ncbi:unnamed protein product [Paramecium pentaurelia]|uniref:Phosphomannomutase n=1 Tax=Paramecium pentaurelia TaxID=43138 RepID=A0A8S1VBA2_9CILI|nr:unnamed protein product [Paramecium pentaurelia]
MIARSKQLIILFDVDGTLTKSRNKIEQNMVDTLKQLCKLHYVGIVGGSDYQKIKDQVGQDVFEMVDFVFTENGLHSFKNGEHFHTQSLNKFVGENHLQQFINFTLLQLSQIQLPIKRGTFIEYRNGMINISPIGRNCSQQERDDFEQYDHQHQIRKQLIEKLENEFKELNFKYSIGGQISFDVFPKGWDKTYCLQFLDEFEKVYFFGDKTFEGGNDHEIYIHERTIGQQVNNPQETIKYLNELFFKN